MVKTKKKIILPSTDEQKNLHQVEVLMRTNLLTLQVSELLVQVAGEKVFQRKKLHSWIDDLVTDISGAKLSIKRKKSIVSEISLQWLSKQKYFGLEDAVNTVEKESIKIDFTAPKRVELVGSYVNQTSTAPLLNIDIVIVMPPDIFEARDILNHAYFDKRRLYLAGLARYLGEQTHDDLAKKYTLSFSWFKGDSRKPILEIAPSTSFMKSNIIVRLIPALDTTVFKSSQLRAEKNNVRPSNWMENLKRNKQEGRKDSDLDPSSLPSTPYYNMAIMEDFSHLISQKLISQAIAPFPSVRDAVILLKVWLTQRMLRFTADGFDGHHAALLMAYLLQTRRVSTQVSALSAFQAALTFLAETDLASSVCDFTKVEVGKVTGPRVFNATLLLPLADKSNPSNVPFNVFWRLSLSTLSSLRSEAVTSLRELQYNQESCFQHLFMQRRSFFERHDIYFHFKMNNDIDVHSARSFAESEEEDVFLMDILKQLENASLDRTAVQYLPDRVVEFSSKALGNRALSVTTFARCLLVSSSADEQEFSHVSNFPSWSLAAASSRENGEVAFQVKWVVSIGITLNKEKALRRVERGPSPATESAEAVQAFRSFWGSHKCQLRRFQDGAIIDAVVWDLDNSLLSKTLIVDDPFKRTKQSGYKPDRVVDTVLRYALGRFFPSICGTEGESLCSTLSAQLEDFCQYSLLAPPVTIGKQMPKEEILQESDADTLTRHAVQALDQLRSVLTSQLKNLPLTFESLSAVTPELRYTALIPVRPHPILLGREALKKHAGETISLLGTPLRILAKLESSGKWPPDVEAVAKCKTAFLLKTRSELKKQFDIHSVIHRDYLDICYQGFIFRLVIVAGNETEVLPYLASIPIEAENRAEIALNAVVKETAIPPLHHQSIKGLHAQYPSYSGAVRLLAVWAAHHYFSGHLCHEILELVVAHGYLHPFTSTAPNSALAGFYQALIRLSSHSWESDPFIIDLSDNQSDITQSDRVQIINSFREVRSSKESDGPHNPAMFIISSTDKLIGFEPSLAAKSPEKPVLGMIVQAAKLSAMKLHRWMSSAEYLPKDLISKDSLQWAEYQAELHGIMCNSSILTTCSIVVPFIKPIINPNYLRGPPVSRLDVYTNLSPAESSISTLLVKEAALPVNPIQEEVVENLRESFKEEAVFFWNAIVGKEVCAVWRPKIFQPKKFTVLESKFVKPKVEDEDDGQGEAEEPVTKRQKVEDNEAVAFTEPNILEIVSQIIDSAEGYLTSASFN